MIRDWFLPAIAGLLGPRTKPAETPTPAPTSWQIKSAFLNRLAEDANLRKEVLKRAFEPARPPPGVIPADIDPSTLPPAMAMDDATAFGQFQAFAINAGFSEGLFWLGYPYLSELSQRPEYRVFIETIAEEMTRKWIEFETADDEDKGDKIKRLEDACEKFHLRERFREAKVLDGTFGIGHLYPDLMLPGSSGRVWEDKEALKSPLIIDQRTVPKGSLKGFIPVEPLWTYPALYNAENPLRDDFYKPTAWYVMGMTVHRSRILTFIGSPVRDLLKASYSFGGMSLIQKLKPYVDYWLQTRNDVGSLVNNFATPVLYTDMTTYLLGGAAEQINLRAQTFNITKSNNGLFMVQKATVNDGGENFEIHATPLTSLPELKEAAKKEMCMIAKVPYVKAFGEPAPGLSGDNDGEIRTFYDGIHAAQERDFSPHLKTALELIQLSEFGKIDPTITHKFVQLWQLDEAGEAAVQKTLADIDEQESAVGALSPQDIRRRLAKDKKSPYAGLSLDEEDAPGTGEVDGEGKPINDPLEREIGRQSAEAGGGGARGAASGV